jgi:hypothetical protein
MKIEITISNIKGPVHLAFCLQDLLDDQLNRPGPMAQILYMMYIVIQPQSYHTTRQISIAYSGLKQK